MTRLMIIDPEKYGMSAEAMLVIREVNFPLVCAASIFRAVAAVFIFVEDAKWKTKKYLCLKYLSELI